jgi:hypothetical protein
MQRPFRLRKAYGATGRLGVAMPLLYLPPFPNLCAFASLREIFLLLCFCVFCASLRLLIFSELTAGPIASNGVNRFTKPIYLGFEKGFWFGYATAKSHDYPRCRSGG